MNKQRRERLLDAVVSLDEAIDIMQEVIDEEQEAYDNLPLSLQESSRGDDMMAAVAEIEGFCSEVSDISSKINRFGTNKKQT